MVNRRMLYLVERSLNNACTPEEKLELAKWLEESDHDKELIEILEKKWVDFEGDKKLNPSRAREMLSSILETEPKEVEQPVVRRLNWRGAAVAATVLVLLGVGSFFLFDPSGLSKPNAVTAQKDSVAPVNDANPGRATAMLTLSDGSRISLDDSPEGTIATQGSTKILNANGELVYDKAVSNRGEILYNTLTTDRGELYPLRLSDGTRIWLNSASSIRFPVVFGSKERKVEINGEAYFEVAKDKNKPFKVLLNGMEIAVLGTQFNVNGYADEANVKTTLLEGSVKIIHGREVLQLSPGQQASLNTDGKISLINNADIEEAVSWKNGYFHFSKDNLHAVMRELSRWYDVDVVYENGIGKGEQSFSGDIQKSLSLSAVLRILGKSQVHYRIEGKKLIVMP